MSLRALATFSLGLAIGAGLMFVLTPSAPTVPVSDRTPSTERESTPRELSSTIQRERPQEVDASDTARAPENRTETASSLMPTAPLDRTCTLRARVVNDSGAAVAQKSFHAKARFGTHAVTGYTTTTADGQLAFVVRGVLPPGVPGVLELEPGAQPYGLQIYVPPPTGASVALPHPLPIGTVDLGEVVLRKRGLIGRGTVTANGRPLANATVTFQVRFAAGQAYQFPVKTAGDGSFELRHPEPAKSASVSMEHGGYLPVASRAIRLGDDDIHLVATRAGSVSGRIRCPPGVRPHIELLTSEGRVHRSPTRWWNKKTGLVRFAFRDVPVGTAVVRYGRSPGALAEQRILVELGHELGEEKVHPDLRDLRIQ